MKKIKKKIECARIEWTYHYYRDLRSMTTCRLGWHVWCPGVWIDEAGDEYPEEMCWNCRKTR